MQESILHIGSILVTSLPASMTDKELSQLQGEILAEVTRVNAKGLILDISAMEIVDSFMVRMLSDIAKMVGLMGTQTVIVGLNPMVAITLVQMGRRLIGAETALNLENGLTKLRQLIGDDYDEANTI